MKKKRSHKLLYAVSVIILVLAIAALGTVWVYAKPASPAKIKVLALFNLPIAKVNEHYLPIRELLDRSSLSENGPKEGVKGSQINKDVYDQLIMDRVTEEVAKKNNVTVTEEEVNLQYQHYLDLWANGDEQKLQSLLKASNVNPKYFKTVILNSSIMQYKLMAWYYGNSKYHANIFNLASDLKAKAEKGGDFSSLAVGYSQDDSTKDFFGNSGFIKLSDTLPEMATALKDSQTGTILLLPSRFGLHVVKVVARDDQSNPPSLLLQQIYLKEAGFDAWLKEESSLIPVKMYVTF